MFNWSGLSLRFLYTGFLLFILMRLGKTFIHFTRNSSVLQFPYRRTYFLKELLYIPALHSSNEFSTPIYFIYKVKKHMFFNLDWYVVYYLKVFIISYQAQLYVNVC